jgi:hypothetical protein
VKQHPVHAQIKIVKDHFMKLERAAEKKDPDAPKKDAVIKRIVERTVNENKRIIEN